MSAAFQPYTNRDWIFNFIFHVKKSNKYIGVCILKLANLSHNLYLYYNY